MLFKYVHIIIIKKTDPFNVSHFTNFLKAHFYYYFLRLGAKRLALYRDPKTSMDDSLNS